MQGTARKLSSTIQSFIALGSETLKKHVVAQTLPYSLNPQPHLQGHTELYMLANIYNNCNFSLTHKAPKLCTAVIIVGLNSIAYTVPETIKHVSSSGNVPDLYSEISWFEYSHG
jgi:hypothetical protein